MQKYVTTEDGNFESETLEGLLAQIERSCFEEKIFLYEIKALYAFDENFNEIALSQAEVDEAQEQLDEMLDESMHLWQSQCKSTYDDERGETFFEEIYG